MSRKYPVLTYVAMIVLGVIPTALVTHYYGHLPNRMVIRWDLLGHMTVIGTRASTVLMVANFAAVAALAATAIGVWQHKSFVALDGLRAFLMLNMAQIVAINLTCIMLVTEALGFHLTIKPMIPPAMALLLFSGGILCWRAEADAAFNTTKAFGAALMGAGVFLLVLNAIAANQIVGYYASAFAALMMTAVLIPSKTQ
ncbi:MAG: hypothetical protein ABL973_14105 [Micropepsaceae bacterium]